jgi:hypothetical protein
MCARRHCTDEPQQHRLSSHQQLSTRQRFRLLPLAPPIGICRFGMLFQSPIVVAPLCPSRMPGFKPWAAQRSWTWRITAVQRAGWTGGISSGAPGPDSPRGRRE